MTIQTFKHGCYSSSTTWFYFNLAKEDKDKVFTKLCNDLNPCNSSNTSNSIDLCNLSISPANGTLGAS